MWEAEPFASTIPLTALTSATVTAPFTITLTGGTLVGTYSEPVDILTGGSGNASATITGGTGSFAGYTGSFPTLAGSSSQVGQGFTFNFTFTGSGHNEHEWRHHHCAADHCLGDGRGQLHGQRRAGQLLHCLGPRASLPPRADSLTFRVPRRGRRQSHLTPAAGGAGIDTYLNLRRHRPD